jgi:hypothetical protein
MYSVQFCNYGAMASNTYRQTLLGSELLALTIKNIAEGYITLAIEPTVQHQVKIVMDRSNHY